MYNPVTFLNLLSNKNKQYLTVKKETDTIYYLVKKPKNQNFEDFYKIDLAADKVKRIKDNFFFCKRFLSNNEIEDFYLKKIEINEKDFFNFLQIRLKDKNELNFILKNYEKNEIYLVIADWYPAKNRIEDTNLFPFLQIF